MNTETISVMIRSGPDREAASGSVAIALWSPRERSRRAFRTLGICWGIGLFCVILPIVHFFAVPALFIAGVVLFARLSAQESLVLGGEGTCPECRKIFRIAKAADRFPMDELCEHCKTSVSISRERGAR